MSKAQRFNIEEIDEAFLEGNIIQYATILRNVQKAVLHGATSDLLEELTYIIYYCQAIIELLQVYLDVLDSDVCASDPSLIYRLYKAEYAYGKASTELGTFKSLLKDKIKECFKSGVPDSYQEIMGSLCDLENVEQYALLLRNREYKTIKEYVSGFICEFIKGDELLDFDEINAQHIGSASYLNMLLPSKRLDYYLDILKVWYIIQDKCMSGGPFKIEGDFLQLDLVQRYTYMAKRCVDIVHSHDLFCAKCGII